MADGWVVFLSLQIQLLCYLDSSCAVVLGPLFAMLFPQLFDGLECSGRAECGRARERSSLVGERQRRREVGPRVTDGLWIRRTCKRWGQLEKLEGVEATSGEGGGMRGDGERRQLEGMGREKGNVTAEG